MPEASSHENKINLDPGMQPLCIYATLSFIMSIDIKCISLLKLDYHFVQSLICHLNLMTTCLTALAERAKSHC